MILVACGSAKTLVAARPRDLYRGSLFNAASRYAEASGHPWRIVSALHGVLDPDGPPIDPYELALHDLDADTRAQWAMRVVSVIGHGPHTSLMSATYDAPLIVAGATLDQPLRGLGIGYRLQWLTTNTHRQEALL